MKARKLLRTGEHGRSNVPIQSIEVHKHVEKAISNLDKEVTEVEIEIENVIKANAELNVITSYSIHYTKLYEWKVKIVFISGWPSVELE